MVDIKTFTAKLGNMRKSVDWLAYPAKKDGRTIIQSDQRIAVFCNDGSNKGLPQEVIDAAVAAQPQNGDTVFNGVITTVVRE